jgi:gliding motility-associated-like protein
MFYRFFPLIFMVLSATTARAQTPQNITLPAGSSPFSQKGQVNGHTKSMACADQFAGTISFANFCCQSNDISLDTMYFCFGDEIDIVHNGDANLTGDPNTLTTPGVTYGFFSCRPTVSGPDLATILTEPCILVGNPPPANGISVTAGGSFNGNHHFQNQGNLQNTYNSGNPVLIWFAPLTIDNFALKQYEVGAGGAAGPCVNLNVDEAFAIVYLNEVKVTNVNNNTGLSGCQGSFTVTGGLPQFDGSNYDITIQLQSNPAIKGQVANGAATHGSSVVFKVPMPGSYTIIVEDGKSCGGSGSVDMNTCVSVTQSVQSATVAPGDNVCLNVTNVSGFVDIVSMQYALTWDTTILQPTGVTNLTPLLPAFNNASINFTNDSLFFAWFNPTGVGVDLPPGTVLYQVCFDVLGSDGECTSIAYSDLQQGSIIEVVNEAGAVLGFNGIDGQVCVSNSALVLTFTQDSVNCPGASDGSFTVTVTGGQAPYQVTWQSAAGGPVQGPANINLAGGSYTASNLPAGTYNVTVKDSQGTPLLTTEQVTVLSPPLLEIVFVPTMPNCSGQPGSLVANLLLDGIQVSNPIPAYKFQWSNNVTIPANTGIFTGMYMLTVTDNSNGCTVQGSFFLNEPPPLIVNISVDTATCSGIGDGAIQISVFGGTPDANGRYTIQWPDIGGGLTIQNTTSNITGLMSEFYHLIVTDDKGCVVDTNLWLPARKVLSVNALVQNINCTAACSGSIQVVGTTTSTDGQPPALPYNFDWFGTPPPPPPTFEDATSSVVNGLCEGIYTVVMYDNAGCKIDTTFNVVEPPPLEVVLVDVKNESCQPGSDGSITVAASGGTYPYSFVWNAPPTDSIATGLAAGTYTVTVEDALGCFDTLTATVTAPLGPTLQAIANDTLDCPNSTNGSLSATATAGSAPIVSYNWSNAQTGQNVTGLSAGQFTVTVADGNGCTQTGSASVIAPAPVTLDSVTLQSPACPGAGGGTVIVFVSGGTSPYLFEWSNGQMGVGQNVLGGGGIVAGDYTVTITDAKNCQPPLVVDATLDDPPAITVSFSAVDSVSCANIGANCDGTATALAQYADGSSGMFDFIWQSGETDNSVPTSTAVQLCSGQQQLIVSDGICNDTFSVNIPAPTPILPGQTIKNVTCKGQKDGEITLLPQGGTPPYSIFWQSGQTGATITGLGAGDYTAIITDSKNCSFSHKVTISEPELFDAFLSISGTHDVSCAGDEDGIMEVIAQGGNLNLGNPIYLWQNGVASSSSNFAANLAPGTYTVTVVDPKGCQDSVTYTISEPPPIQFSIGLIEPIQCFGGNTFITVDSVWGGNLATYQFSVDGGINRLPGTPSPVFAGQHTITVIDVVAGCTADTSVSIVQPVELKIDLQAEIEIELGDSLTRLEPKIFSSLPIDSFMWNPAEFLSCANCKNPTVTAVESQLYTLTIVDINGCAASASIFVDVDRNRNVFIPNVFSPNNDGINDQFRIFTGIGVTKINFIRIYDRWGELMFKADNLPPSTNGVPGWDGSFNGETMNPAVFMYLIEVEFLDGQVLLYRGDVTLLR